MSRNTIRRVTRSHNLVAKGVFISYSGTVSRAVAHELCAILKRFLGIEVRLLPQQIGKPMVVELLAALDASDFGICCFTRENQRSRWVYFEAGALLRFFPQQGAVHNDDLNRRMSTIVPFYYPDIPRTEDPTDDPLRSFMGLAATPSETAQLVRTVAAHLKSKRSRLKSAVRHAWTAACRRIRAVERKEHQRLRVGRFNPRHNRILDNCSRIERNHPGNDFNRFLCDRILRSVEDATEELGHRQQRGVLSGFSEFAKAVTDELDHTSEIVALCGSKPWERPIVAQYYAAQFRWAKTCGSTLTPIMRRVFVQPSGSTAQAQRTWARIRQVAGEHAEYKRHGVEARIISERQARATERDLARVWSALLDQGFGFIVMCTRGRWKLFAHMRRNDSSGEAFIGARLESQPVVTAALTLFEKLWRFGRPYRLRGTESTVR